MPLGHATTVYDTQEMRVYPLTGDPTNSASPTFGTGVEVQGVDSVSVTPNYQSAELKGSGRVIARRSRIDRWQSQVTYDKLDLDVATVIFGGSGVVDTASTSADWVHDAATSATPYFGAGIAIDQVDLGFGGVHLFLFRCQTTDGGLLDQSSDSFGQPTFNFDAIPLDSSTHRMLRLRLLADPALLPADLATVVGS